MCLQSINNVFESWSLSFCIQMPNKISIEKYHIQVLSKTAYIMRNHLSLAAVIEHHKLSGINSGLCSRSASYRFSSQTLLVTDVILTHPFDLYHTFKSDSLRAWAQLNV
jgi:hypothetical protein